MVGPKAPQSRLRNANMPLIGSCTKPASVIKLAPVSNKMDLESKKNEIVDGAGKNKTMNGSGKRDKKRKGKKKKGKKTRKSGGGKDKKGKSTKKTSQG